MTNNADRTRKKRRPFLTILTAACMVAILMVFLGILERRSEYKNLFNELGNSVIVIFGVYRNVGGSRHYIDHKDMMEVARSLTHISKIFAKHLLRSESSSYITLLHTQRTTQATGRGVDAGYDKFRGYRMKSGRFFEKSDELCEVAVINERVAGQLGAKVQDRILFMDRELEIIGIIANERSFCASVGLHGNNIYLPVEIERQINAAKPVNIYTPESLTRVYLVFTPGKRDVIIQEANRLLGAKLGRGNDYFIGEDMTAYGYLDYTVSFWAVFLFLLFSICLVINIRSLTSFLSQDYPGDKPTLDTRHLIATSGVGGVTLGVLMSHLLMDTPILPILPALVSLAIVMPLELFIVKKRLKKLGV